jgi:hypothetical protein|uniref:Uncharacterized protein n=1 Tax=viral metagenome TaxID=1070528 RepID=A0A6C0F953_9ZZZZ
MESGLGATDLSELLGGQPVQSPAFQPMVTGGGDPFSTPLNTSPPKSNPVDYSRQFSVLRGSVRGFLGYLAFFLAAGIMSLAFSRELALRYVPHAYKDGGIVSYTGAAVLGGASVVLAYVINTLFNTLV